MFPILLLASTSIVVVSGRSYQECIDRCPKPSLCTPGRFYCGSELSDMGYTNTQPNILYMCTPGRDGHVYKKCDSCITDAAGSYCPCTPTMHYCGYELAAMNFHYDPIADHGLYHCDDQHTVTKLDGCVLGCYAHGDKASHCNEVIRPPQVPILPPGTKFCGYELGPTHFHIEWHPQHLYVIGPDGSAVPAPGGECPSGCIKHDVTDSHCDSANLIATSQQVPTANQIDTSQHFPIFRARF